MQPHGVPICWQGRPTDLRATAQIPPTEHLPPSLSPLGTRDGQKVCEMHGAMRAFGGCTGDLPCQFSDSQLVFIRCHSLNFCIFRFSCFAAVLSKLCYDLCISCAALHGRFPSALCSQVFSYNPMQTLGLFNNGCGIVVHYCCYRQSAPEPNFCESLYQRNTSLKASLKALLLPSYCPVLRLYAFVDTFPAEPVPAST